jgi:acetyltransferase-like isoleucine patch superfamily enzyme
MKITIKNSCLTRFIITLIKHRGIHFFKYLYYSLRYKTNFNLVIFLNSTVKFHKKTTFDLKSQLLFNKSWVSNDPFPSLISTSENSTLIVDKHFRVVSGSKIYINKNAVLHLKGGYSNDNLYIDCFKYIQIGHNATIEKNVTIRDNNGHFLKMKDYTIEKDVIIGNNVWIGMNTTILPGANIGDGSVIASNSLVNCIIPPNELWGGIPAKKLRSNILWHN